MSVVRSISDDQQVLLRTISELHAPEGFECDLTYGSGQFYKSLPKPALRFDVDPQSDDVVQGCSTAVALPTGTLSSVVVDPPFLTYVRAARTGNGAMVMAKRFSGYWTYGELTDHYRGTLTECARILKRKGVLVFKCQDIVHNHRLHPTHVSVIGWAAELGLRLKDLFILAANHRMPSPNRAGAQKHARIFHSYFLVFERT